MVTSTPLRRTAAWGVPSLLTLAGLVVISPGAAAAPLSPCVETDNGKPRIHSISFSPTSVDVTEAAQQVTVRMTASDGDGPGPATGLAAVRLTLRPPAGDLVDGNLRLAPAGGDRWEKTFTVPRGAPAGEWKVYWAGLRDFAGNVLEDTEAEGYDYLARFDHVALDVTTVPDTESPRVTGFRLSEKIVDNRRTAREVKVRVTATDDVSGLEDGEVNFSNDAQWQRVRLAPVDDNTLKGVLRLPRDYGAGRWKAQWMTIRDSAGNTTLRRKTAISDLGRRWFRVLGTPDTERPQVLSAVAQPSRLDVREEAQRTKIRVWLADPETGVRSATVLVPGRRKLQLTRVRGTEHKGLWVGTVRFGTCFDPVPTLGDIRIRDRNQNQRWRSLDRFLSVKALDNRAPWMSLRDTVLTPTQPVRLYFSEKVNGIGDDTLTVRELTDGPSPLAPTPGSWTCTDADGAATPCETGEVVEALWQATGPLAPARYLVTANPEGVLGLTDLRGNPVSEATQNQELPDNVRHFVVRPEE